MAILRRATVKQNDQSGAKLQKTYDKRLNNLIRIVLFKIVIFQYFEGME